MEQSQSIGNRSMTKGAIMITEWDLLNQRYPKWVRVSIVIV